MNTDKTLENRIGELVIDGDYLRLLHTEYGTDWVKKLSQDLSSVGSGTVYFKQPDKKDVGGLYPDVRSYIAAIAVKQGYTIVTDSYDASVLKRLWRGLIVGDEKTGYKYNGNKYKFA